MTLQQQQFLELLRSGLWDTPADTNLFSGNVDWKTILRIAMEQTVQVIVADGIETLPKELWPPKEAMLKLMMVRVKTNQMHQLLNSTLNQIVNALNAEGIPSVLLKGQGVAQNYRNPESRMCGDIDLYVGEKNYERACEIIADMDPNGKDGKECDHHMHLQVNGVEVEIHRQADYMPGKKSNKELQGWTMKSIDQNFGTDTLGIWNNSGTVISLAPPTFDAFFILHHAVRHMTTEGVGFRQICDWVMYMHRHHAEINAQELESTLRRSHLSTVWTEFCHLATDILGLPQQELPLPLKNKTSSKTKRLLQQIFISGNFGRFDINARDHSETTYLKRKWRSFRYQSMRLFKLCRLFPKYTFTYTRDWIRVAIVNILKKK